MFADPPNAVAEFGQASLVTRTGIFIDAMDRLPSAYPNTKRIAFAGVAELEVADRATGYRKASDYLPFDVDAETSSEFAYQINRPRSSCVLNGLSINRVSRWSVGMFRHVTIQVSPGGISAAPTPPDPKYHLRLEFDINTDPTFAGVLERAIFPHLMRELVQFGEEIVQQGDL
jgi:hypothetical protein